jgi:hypothetical protein
VAVIVSPDALAAGWAAAGAATISAVATAALNTIRPFM